MKHTASARSLKIPLWGGVAVAKRLTGWSVTFLHTLGRTTPALRATPPKEGNCPVAKRLTGWSVAFLHTLGGPPRRFAPPLLRRGIGPSRAASTWQHLAPSANVVWLS